MKQLTCEMCGSTDLIKKDGVFVCQACGCKYDVEEAKKMMVEGPVDVSGSTVRVDTSQTLDNLYQLARRARDDENDENAAKYYERILMQDPNSWEAAFYSIYFQAMQCKIAQIQSAAKSVTNNIDTVLYLILNNVPERDKQIAAVSEIAGRCDRISTMFFSVAQNHYQQISSNIRNNYTQEYINRCAAARDIMYTLGDQIDRIFSGYNELTSTTVSAWKSGIMKHNSIMPHLSNKSGNQGIIENYANKVRKYEKGYETPQPRRIGGCYVATCVYGSYDCPPVWTLRRFRDDILAKTAPGRAFIRVYYAVSPALVKRFGQMKWFQVFWRLVLNRLVSRLQRHKGISNTPYED